MADKHRGPGLGPAYTDLAYYGVRGPTTILKGRARRGPGGEGGGDGEAHTRGTPNIDLFEISNSSLSCRDARGNARRVRRARQSVLIRYGSVINSVHVLIAESRLLISKIA